MLYFPDAPDGDHPPDPAGPLGFRCQPCERDMVSAPGGATALWHPENGHATFAGASSSSASTTSPFRDSMAHPVHPLFTLQTPRYRDACKTRSRPACSALAGPDLHRQVDISFPNAPRTRLTDGLLDMVTQPPDNVLFRAIDAGLVRRTSRLSIGKLGRLAGCGRGASPGSDAAANQHTGQAG